MRLNNYINEWFGFGKKPTKPMDFSQEIQWLLQNLNKKYLILLKKITKTGNQKIFLEYICGIEAKKLPINDKMNMSFQQIHNKNKIIIDFGINPNYRQKFNSFIDSEFNKKFKVSPIRDFFFVEGQLGNMNVDKYNFVFPIGQKFDYFFSWDFVQFFEDYTPGIEMYVATLMKEKPEDVIRYHKDDWEYFGTVESILKDGKTNWTDLIESPTKKPFGGSLYISGDKFIVYNKKKYTQLVSLLFEELRK